MSGVLARLEFLQDWASILIASLPPAVLHNLEKYDALKKVFFLSSIENIEGDYLEFGIYRGSSFCHALRCFKQLSRQKSNVVRAKFYGFESFAGFGELETKDRHPFYVDKNFATSLEKTERRVRRVAGHIPFQIIPGFFQESLKEGAVAMGIKKARIIFIDSDTYVSASAALTFCASIVQTGTFIMLDDYFSYRGREDRGVRFAFKKFLENGGVKARRVFDYGMGGAAFVISQADPSLETTN